MLKKFLFLIYLIIFSLSNNIILYAYQYNSEYLDEYSFFYKENPSLFNHYSGGNIADGTNFTDKNATVDGFDTFYKFFGAANIDMFVKNTTTKPTYWMHVALEGGEKNKDVNIKIFFEDMENRAEATIYLEGNSEKVYFGNLETNATDISIGSSKTLMNDFYFGDIIATNADLIFYVRPSQSSLVSGNKIYVNNIRGDSNSYSDIIFSVNDFRASSYNVAMVGYSFSLINNTYMTIGYGCDTVSCIDSKFLEVSVKDNSTLLISNINATADRILTDGNSTIKIANGKLYTINSHTDLEINNLYLDNGILEFDPEFLSSNDPQKLLISGNTYITGKSSIISVSAAIQTSKNFNIDNAEFTIDSVGFEGTGATMNSNNSNINIYLDKSFNITTFNLNNDSNLFMEVESIAIDNFYMGENTSADIKISAGNFVINNDFTLQKSTLKVSLPGIFQFKKNLYLTDSLINVNGNLDIQKDLYLNESEITVSKDSNINGNLYVVGGSKFKTGAMNVTGNIELELNSYNMENFLFEVNSFVVSGFINIKANTSDLIKVGEIYEYKVVKSGQSISPLNINYMNDTDWVTYNDSYFNNELIITGERTKTYGQVLEESGDANDFSLSLAEMIDTEMEDGVVSDNLSKYIQYLDGTQNSEGLNKALGSNNPVDQEDFINYISKYSLGIVQNVKNNLNGNNFWVDGSYNLGKQNTATTDKGFILSLGYNALFNDDSMIATLFGGFSVGGLTAENYTSDNNAIYVGVGLFALIKESEHVLINVLLGSNSFDTVRKDLSGMEYSGNNTYQNINIYGEYGIETAGKTILYKTNFYLDLNYINMKQYKENSDLGYSYEDKAYGVSNFGVDFVITKEEIEEGFFWQISAKLGYQMNFGGSNNLIFNMDNSALIVTDNSVDNSGIYVNPNLGLGYVFDEKNKINFSVGYENMLKSYTNAMVKFMYTLSF